MSNWNIIMMEKWDYNLIVAYYLELKDGKFSLNISDEIVAKSGITAIVLEDAKEELAKTKELIAQMKSDPKNVITLVDPKVVIKAAPTGTLTTNGTLSSNTIIDVPLYVSNDYIRVAFRTTDSNGGSAAYEGIY